MTTTIPAEVLRKSGPCSSLTGGVDGKSQEQRQQVARRGAPRPPVTKSSALIRRLGLVTDPKQARGALGRK